MPTVLGRQCRIEIALTYGPALTINAVSKASPAVATASAAHTLAVGTVGFFSVTDGMAELHNQAARVQASATPAFTLQSLDTTTYSTAVTGGATYTPALTWGLVDSAAGYEIQGGEADQIEDTRLQDAKKRNVTGMLAAQGLSVTTRPQTVNNTVMERIEAAARNNTALLWRITLSDGSVRVYHGIPSMPGESVQAGQLASGSFSVTGDGWVLKGAA